MVRDREAVTHLERLELRDALVRLKRWKAARDHELWAAKQRAEQWRVRAIVCAERERERWNEVRRLTQRVAELERDNRDAWQEVRRLTKRVATQDRELRQATR